LLLLKSYGTDGSVACRSCGGGKRRLNKKAEIKPIVMGEIGLTELRYEGGAGSPLIWPGPLTHWPYKFGGSKRLGYVDTRDAEIMVAGPFIKCL